MSSQKTPPAWADLTAALTLLAKGHSNAQRPLICEKDTLVVMADPAKFTPKELAQLDKWGFFSDESGEECFYSSRYGSA